MLETEDRSGVTVLRLKHGKVNALDTELLRAITAAFQDLDPTAAVVLTGHGSAFSAGVDLKRIVDGGQPYVREFLPALTETFLAVFNHPGPVVAAVNGHAIAGGCVLAAACDARLMSGGRIGLAELSVGVPFPTVALEIMRHAVGPAVGNLVLTARLLDAALMKSAALNWTRVLRERRPKWAARRSSLPGCKRNWKSIAEFWSRPMPTLHWRRKS